MFCAMTAADQRRGVRYLALMVGAFGLTFSMTIIRHRYLPRVDPGVAHDLIALLPLLGLAGIVGAVADFILHADEYVQRRLIGISAAAGALTLLCTMGYGLLESAGWPHRSMSTVWGIMGVSFMICSAIDTWRRKR